MESIFNTRSSYAVDTRRPDYQELKSKLHQGLLDRLDLDRLAYIKREEAEPEIRRLIIAMLERELEQTPLTLSERDTLTVDVLNELLGLGPPQLLLKEQAVTGVLVNRF